MITWTKINGKWAARGPLCEFLCGKYVTVTSKDGRVTLCRITGVVPAATGSDNHREPTEAEWNRIVTVEVERETRPIWELMREVPYGH